MFYVFVTIVTFKHVRLDQKKHFTHVSLNLFIYNINKILGHILVVKH